MLRPAHLAVGAGELGEGGLLGEGLLGGGLLADVLLEGEGELLGAGLLVDELLEGELQLDSSQIAPQDPQDHQSTRSCSLTLVRNAMPAMHMAAAAADCILAAHPWHAAQSPPESWYCMKQFVNSAEVHAAS